MRETYHGFYLADSEAEVLLPKGQCAPEMRIGDMVRLFVYTDSEDRPIATIKKPIATVGEFAKLRVVSVTGAGAFLDWGLDKDLFCALGEQQAPMREGGEYLVRVYLDEVSQRVTCTSKFSRFLRPDGEGLELGQRVKIIVAGKTPDLISVIVDGSIRGSLFPDEWHEKLQIGDVRDAYVKAVREVDGKVAVSLRPQGYKAVLSEADRLLEKVKASGGSLAVSDKSTPEEIHKLFGLSKGAFKRLIGALYRDGRIVIDPDRIRLVK
jgi:predicted RNA-binding protein (virulence factor B family)